MTSFHSIFHRDWFENLSETGKEKIWLHFRIIKFSFSRVIQKVVELDFLLLCKIIEMGVAA